MKTQKMTISIEIRIIQNRTYEHHHNIHLIVNSLDTKINLKEIFFDILDEIGHEK